MKSNDKIMLLCDYTLEEYDVNLFTQYVQFKKGEMFTIEYITKISKYHRQYIEYVILNYKDSLLRYRIETSDILYFKPWDLIDERRVKLNTLNELQ